MGRLVDNPKSKLSTEDVATLKDLIDISLRKDSKFFRALKVWRDMLEGEQWKHLKGASARRKKEARMVVNLAHAHVRSLLPTIYFRDPTVDAMPPAPQYEGKHLTYNAVINNTNRKIGFTREMKKVVMDGILYPEGWHKWVVNRPDDTKSDSNKTTETGKRGPTQWLSKGSPVPVRLSPNQVIVDYLATGRDPEEARFIAIRYQRPLSEIKKRYKLGRDFKRTTAQDDKPTIARTVRNVFDDFDNRRESAKNDELVTIYEVWIHQLVDLGIYQQMCVLMEDHDKPIRELTSWEEVMGQGFDRFPVNRLAINPVPDGTAVSELEVWDTLQVGVNWLMSRLVSLTELEKQVWEFNPNKVKNPAKARKQFLEGGVRALVDVQDEGAFNLLQSTFPGRDNYTLLNTMLAMIQQVSGLGQNRRGSSGIRTATEADLIEQGVQLKTSEKVETVRQFLIEVIESEVKIIRALVMDNPDGLRWVFRIGGDTGTISWKEFKSDELDWMPDIEIRVDSFRKEDGGEVVQRLQQAMLGALQMIQIGQPVNIQEIYRQMLVALQIPDTSRIMGDDLNDIIHQTTELMNLVLGGEAQVRPTDNHMVHRNIIAAFKNSQRYQELVQQDPGIADRVDQHDLAHEEMMMQQAETAGAAQKLGQNPFDEPEPQRNGTPQSEANTLTARDRTTIDPGRQTP